MTYGYCVYHEIDCDYDGQCIDCPHNTKKDTEWFKQDEERVESEEYMGMDYNYSGSSSYPRFREDMEKIDTLVGSDDIIFVSWIADPYKRLSAEDTKHLYDILKKYIMDNPSAELPFQPLNELEECVYYGEGWSISR